MADDNDVPKGRGPGGNGDGGPDEPGGHDRDMPNEPPGDDNSMPREPPGDDNSMPREPPGDDNSMPSEPPGDGNGMPSNPPGDGNGMPSNPPGDGNGMPREPSGEDNGMPSEPPGDGNGMPSEPPGDGNGISRGPVKSDDGHYDEPMPGGGGFWDAPDGGAGVMLDDDFGSGGDYGPEPVQDYTKEELLSLWERFFTDTDYSPHIEGVADQYPDQRSVFIDYWKIDLFDNEFALYILEAPDRCIHMAEVAVRNLLPPDNKCPIHVRLNNLPIESARVEIRHLRSNHMDKMLAIDGLVRKAVEVRPRLEIGLFQCSMCEGIMRVEQDGKTIAEPMECSKDAEVYIGEPGCGRPLGKTRFKLLQKESVFIDTQKIEIQEAPEGLRGGAQPERLTAYLEDDLVGQIFPGDRVVLNGTLRAAPRQSGPAQKTLFDIFLRVNSIELEAHAYEEVQISDEEEAQIEALAKDPQVYELITQSIAPSIYGLDTEKSALMLQLFGGVTKTMHDETRIRGDIHILMVGDPGTAKSQLLRYISNLAPRGIYASGKSASAAGLTAAAVKDEFGEGRWTLEAGALVLADKGIACIDELDKMTTNDRSSMHEAMEQQSIHVAKAGITATLQSRCSILAAANPKLGRFDTYASIFQQINLDPPLMSRFDLIFSITDTPDKDKDTEMARNILRSHRAGEISMQRKESEKGSSFTLDDEEAAHEMHKPPLKIDLLRKYVAHAKRSIFPVMTEEALKTIMDYYVDLRRQGQERGTISITARQLEAFVRLAEASARIRLSGEATGADAKRAIMIVDYYLRKVAGTEGGFIDYDSISTGISASQRDVIKCIHNIIRNGVESEPDGMSLDQVYAIAEAENNIERDKTRDILQKLIRDGTIYTPKHNVVKPVNPT